MTGDPRTGELSDNLARLRDRIAAACRTAGRDPDEVTLIAVTKTFPAEDIRRLLQLGVRDIGENRDQEAGTKVAALAGEPVVWHFVGQLQTNKCRSVAGYAAVVHSVDRPRLVAALDRAAQTHGRRITALVQVGLSAAGGRGGAPPDRVDEVAGLIAGAASLDLGGVMAVAPLGADADPAFARLAAVAERVRRAHPGARIVSAGMSEDLEAAVQHGATHLRIGSALLGARPPQVR